ncbi:MAG TPA: adenylyltransferase/cytidyltransferase family protein [Candidatus Paceibacterota bacterium]|nr:adenylyltransferase/cytidyltransferase family protein [Candidatus Paceibacterota bacterium]
MKKRRVRSATKKNETWVMVSGGFDPIHIGHVRMFEEARMLGDKLVVVINNDNWLRSKKGFAFMPERERKEIIAKFPFVDKVVLTKHKKNDPDRSVSRELAAIKPAIFANGGDRKSTKDIPEAAVCKKLGIKMVFNLGKGGKVQSSSWVIRDASRNFVRSVRPWGEFYGWDAGSQWKLKTMYIHPGKRLSLQYHHHRREQWVLVQGDATATIHDKEGKPQTKVMKIGEPVFVDVKAIHRLESKRGGIVVEVALGKFDENDIVRIEDDYSRV